MTTCSRARELGAKESRLAVATSTVVALIFAALKTCPALAATYTRTIGVLVCDPTDLMALPFAYLGPRWCGRLAARASVRPSPVAQRGLVVAASLACVATSPPPPKHANDRAPSAIGDGPLGCASARIVGDRVSAHSGEVFVEVKNESGHDGCTMNLGALQNVRLVSGRGITVRVVTPVTVDAGEVRSVSVPLHYPDPDGPPAMGCESRRLVDIWFQPGADQVTWPVYRDAQGITHRTLRLEATECLDVTPLAR